MSPTGGMLFSRISPRTQRLLGTAAASYLARLASALSLLITIPLARQTLSSEMFGIWMMLSSLLAFFSFADLGVGNGVISRLTTAHGRADRLEALDIMRAGYICTAGAALLLLLCGGLWASLAENPLRFAGSLAPSTRNEAGQAFACFLVLLALNLPLSLAQRLQLATQQGHWVGITQAVAAVGSLIAVPTALWLKLSLPCLVLASLGSNVLVGAVAGFLWLRRQGYLHELLRMRTLPLRSIREVLQTGAAYFVLQMCAAFAFQSDAFVIAQTLGQQVYGDFAAIQRVFLSVSTLAGAALLGLWPAFGDAISSGDMRWARHMLTKALLTGAASMGGLCLALTWLMPWLASAWLHMDAAPPLALTGTLALWTLIDTLGNISSSFLNGSGLVSAQLRVAIAMSSLAFAGKWLLVPILGSFGAVVATILAYLSLSVPAQFMLIRQVLNTRRVEPMPVV